MTEVPSTQRFVLIDMDSALDFRTAQNFRIEFDSWIAKGRRTFVLNFSQTGILDSTGLGMLFGLHKQASRLGGQVFIAAPTRAVEAVLKLTHTSKVMPSVETVDEAVLAAIEHESLVRE